MSVGGDSQGPLPAGELDMDLREVLQSGLTPTGGTGVPAGPGPTQVGPPGSAGAVAPAGGPLSAGVPDADGQTGDGACAGAELAQAAATIAEELLPDAIYRMADGREVEDTRGRLSQRLRDLFTSPPARREAELDHQLQQLRIRGLARGVTVALGSIKGGVGKTTLTLALADMLADSLRCGVVVVDADLEWGTAADSTPQAGRRGGTLVDVLRARDQINSPGDLVPYLLTLPGGAQLLAGPTDPQEIENLGSEDMGALLDLLRRFFPVVLLDLSPGIGLRGTIPRWAFSNADEIVAISSPTRAALRRAGRMLGYLAEHHPSVPVTLALNMVPRRPDAAVARVIEVAREGFGSRRYTAVPRDDALMRQLDAGRLNIAELDQATRIALKDLAVNLAGGWCR
jgi:MinD-like ATPase involved in chromosome partitioning or flagellar assembly